MSADHALHTLEWLRYAEEARIDEMVTPQNLLSTVGRTQSRARLETYRARFEEYIRVGDEKQAFHDNEVAAVTGGGAGAAALDSFKTRWAEAELSMRAIEDRMVALEQQGITVVFALLDLLDERPDSLAYGMDCQCWAAGDRDTEAAFAGLTSELVAIGRSGEEINAEWAAAARENAQILRDSIPQT
jgi:hypothetical protein